MRIPDNSQPGGLIQDRPSAALGPATTATTSPPTALSRSDFLTPGKILAARVLQQTATGDITLLISGREVTAKSPMPLPVGKEIWLEVKAGGPPPWLALADKKGSAAALLQLLAKQQGAINQLFRSLATDGLDAPAVSTALTSNTSVPAAMPGHPFMAVGKDFNCADLIAFLALLARKADSANATPSGAKHDPGPLFPDLNGKGRIVNQFIEMTQSINAATAGADETPYYLYPCFFSGYAGWGEWLFSFSEKGASGKQQSGAHQLDFMLQMSNLGSLSLHVNLEENRLNGRFLLESEQIQKYMESMVGDLADRLEGLGYTCRIQCALGGENQLSELKKIIENKMKCPPFALLDIRA